MVKATFAIGMALIAMAATDATKINFVNQCVSTVELYRAQAWSTFMLVSGIAPGTTYVYNVTGTVNMFSVGFGADATLAEFSIPGDGKAWYDISIIPAEPGNCYSYENCKQVTGKKGFNVPLNIVPKQNANGQNCQKLVCAADSKLACADAYHFPADKTKTHDCPESTEFDVVFCPSGTDNSGAAEACRKSLGYNISSTLSPPFKPCCDICRKTPGCRDYLWSTHNGGTCWLKSIICDELAFRVQMRAGFCRH